MVCSEPHNESERLLPKITLPNSDTSSSWFSTWFKVFFAVAVALFLFSSLDKFSNSSVEITKFEPKLSYDTDIKFTTSSDQATLYEKQTNIPSIQSDIDDTTESITTKTKPEKYIDFENYIFQKPEPLKIPTTGIYPNILNQSAFNEVFACAQGEESCREQPVIEQLFKNHGVRMSHENYLKNIQNKHLHTSVVHSNFTKFRNNTVKIEARNYFGELKIYGGDWWRARVIAVLKTDYQTMENGRWKFLDLNYYGAHGIGFKSDVTAEKLMIFPSKSIRDFSNGTYSVFKMLNLVIFEQKSKFSKFPDKTSPKSESNEQLFERTLSRRIPEPWQIPPNSRFRHHKLIGLPPKIRHHARPILRNNRDAETNVFKFPQHR